jgi:Ni/Co efflux regulator RcnB
MRALLIPIAIAMTPVLAIPQAHAQTKPAPGKNKKLAHSAQKAVEEVTPIDEDNTTQLNDEELAVAKNVYVGDLPCELGAKVKITPMKRAGFFMISTKNYRFRMHPVESRTGAIRLEDPQRGAMWLQLGNKSMLMSQKLGQRLADECQSPEQITYAEKLKANPLPSILDSTPGPQSTSTLKQPGS